MNLPQRSLRISVTAFLILIGGYSMAERGQKNSIWKPTPTLLNGAQAKLTWLGEQTKPIPTVVFSVGKLSMPAFQERQGDSRSYGNDSMPYTRSFNVTAEQFQECLDGLRPVLTDLAEEPAKPKGLPSNERRSLSLTIAFVVPGGQTTGHEFLLNQADWRKVYPMLIEKLKATPEAVRHLQFQFGAIDYDAPGQRLP